MRTPYSPLVRTAVPGVLAGVLSALILSWRGRCDVRSALAPLNAPSHWLYGAPALRESGWSWRYTALGLLIHHASALMWASVFDRVFHQSSERDKPAQVMARAAAFTGVAALVDFKVVPERLMPGFDQHLSRKSLLMVYGAFAAGLALGVMVLNRKRR